LVAIIPCHGTWWSCIYSARCCKNSGGANIP
jgi:hypothetical protein